MARSRHAAAHDAHWHTRRKLRQHVTEGRRWFFTGALAERRLLRENPRHGLDKIERALDFSAKLLRRLQFAVGDEVK